MDNENSVIYGLEFQARVLAPQLAETEKICFIIGTQSLKKANNQVHLIEFDDENSTLKTQVYYHVQGEIWKINSSPHNKNLLTTCYNTVTEDNTCCMNTSILRFPQSDDVNEIQPLQVVNTFHTEQFGNDVKTLEFHPTDETKVIVLTENHIVLYDTSVENAKCITNYQLTGKNNPKYTIGKWNSHQNCTQFTTATDVHIKTYDTRTGQIAWNIDNAHNQLVRDIDYNLNKQYHLATCGDDAFMKIWDFRQTNKPVYARSDHSHWVWCVRFNPFHDQLILTASSDARVLLSSAASVSSEYGNDLSITEENDSKQILSDGPLQWCEHEDSVYCAEWSPAEPWIFASLSYDGRLLISRVKRSLKYQIML